MNLQQTSRLYDFLTDLAAAKKERDELAFEDAKEAAARAVTFDDVLEELTELDSAAKAHLMQSLDTDRRHFIFRLEAAFTDAVEKIARRRAWAEITKGSA